MQRLHEVLSQSRDAVVSRWREALERTLVPASMPDGAIVDSLALVLDQLIEELRSTGEITQEVGPVSARHGAQRLRLGFDVGSVVREYAVLRDCIFEELDHQGAQPAVSEVRAMDRFFDRSMADAVTEYARQRDDDMSRETARHFGFIAHEVRNPLGAARLCLAVLERQMGQRPRALESVERNLQRLSDVVDAAVADLRGRAAGMPPHMRELAFDELAADIVDDARAQAEHRAIQIQVDVEPDLTLFADPILFHSVIVNLVRNAVNFSRDGGLVALRGRRLDGWVEIDVEDSCGGLPPGRAEEMFLPVQAGSSQHLGLTIARLAVQAHGGSIRVLDLGGRGCCFTVRLPASPRPSAPIPPSVSAPPA